jgi:hypothetical protein
MSQNIGQTIINRHKTFADARKFKNTRMKKALRNTLSLFFILKQIIEN